MFLSPQSIEAKCHNTRTPLIEPFHRRRVHEYTGMSGGLSCAGYDVHMGLEVTVPEDELGKLFNETPQWVRQDKSGQAGWWLPPRTGCLAVTQEKFHLPDDVVMFYYNKSTLARKFISACATLGEPGWHGHLTLEIYNQTDRGAFLAVGQPIGQVVFGHLDEASRFPYRGKYQGQAAKPVQAMREK